MIRSSIICVGLLALAGCSSGGGKTPIVVYSPHGKEMLEEFERQFEAAHPETDVQWLDMGSQDAYDRVRTERDNPQADVWWGAPMTAFARAEEEGLLERYVPSWDSAEAPEFKSPRGYWYGTFITPEVIMYNTEMIASQDAPKDWDELLEPQWRDKIIIRYPLASGTMRIIFSALIQREIARTADSTAGFRWLQRLDANTKTYVADPTQLYLGVARQEAPLTVWDLPDVQLQVETNHYPFGYVIPASGTPLVTDCIAIVKGAKHPEQARAFYEFVTSRESMIRQAAGYYRIPSRRDIPASSLPPWISKLTLRPMDVDWKSIALHEKEWMKEWDEQVKGSGKRLITTP
jgi:iron(III) transport system substrate-binding protein